MYNKCAAFPRVVHSFWIVVRIMYCRFLCLPHIGILYISLHSRHRYAFLKSYKFGYFIVASVINLRFCGTGYCDNYVYWSVLTFVCIFL